MLSRQSSNYEEIRLPERNGVCFNDGKMMDFPLASQLGAELMWLKFSTVIRQEAEIWNEKYQLKSDKTISEKKQGLSWDVLEMQVRDAVTAAPLLISCGN